MTRGLINVFLLGIFVLVGAIHSLHPDFDLNVYELINKHGYEYEVHSVQTEDGYILELQRIPHGKDNQNLTSKPPIFLMHGLLSLSADWINIGPEKSLAYKLADQGYDVWLGNTRGTTNSRKHITLDPDYDSQAFYNFTWNEIGWYDLPANIDYILEVTGHDQLQYVGFSQGTTVFFIMASERPDYNQKIKLMTALAPVAEMTYIKHPFAKFLAQYEKAITWFFQFFNLHEFLPYNDVFKVIGKEFCDDGKWTQEFCKMVFFVIAGYDREQLEGGFMPVIVSNDPGGIASMQLAHVFQIINNGGAFRKYNYGNEDELGEKYNLSKITAPVAFYYAQNDWLASEKDTEHMAKQIPNIARLQLIDYKPMNHVDFQWAIDIVDLVFNDVVDLINKYK